MTISSKLIEQLVTNRHANPFAVLGAHATSSGWVVRAYLPQAEAVWAVVGDREYPLHACGDLHFFEGEIPSPEREGYRLRYRHGQQERAICDPYAFRDSRLSDFDLHLFAEGNHRELYQKLGAHLETRRGVLGVAFTVWAPRASNVAVVGDFNEWDERSHQMGARGGGIWELFVPGLGAGDRYKYAIRSDRGKTQLKADPYGFRQEVRPKTASIVADLDAYVWQDAQWLERRRTSNPLDEPISIYEVHLGSWWHVAIELPTRSLCGQLDPVCVSELKPGARFLTYYELADALISYVKGHGYTHVELLPIAEHPFDGSSGYQVTGYYACSSRYGTPTDLMYFVDKCHQNGIGVILDWVPAYFSRDAHGLALFDGAPLYEPADPRLGEHREWGTLAFDYSRPEVRNFLLANALFWLDKYHIDGIRFNTVAAMLYRDYRRKEGEWLPNSEGGREYLEGIELLRQLNSTLFDRFPGILAIAEESTVWPLVTAPVEAGGLGFNLKWNVGWTQDVLDYFAMDPWFRQFHQNNLTNSIHYTYNENYLLALSHDDIVRGKGNLWEKVPGDPWQQFAHLRCLFAYMFAHPGKKMMFASMEFGQREEWNIWSDLDWSLLQEDAHQKLRRFVCKLNHFYRREPALHTGDFQREGFEWIDCKDNRHSVISFLRWSRDRREFVVVVCNFTPQPHSHYRIGVPKLGFYRELFNSDAREYGGSNMGNLGGKWTDNWPFHNRPYSLDLCLPPLGVLVFKLDRDREAPESIASRELPI